MKTLKYILALAFFAGIFAACDDEPVIDKAVLGGYDDCALLARQNGDCFELDWSNFRLYTTNGDPIVSLGGGLSYDVSVSIFDVNDEWNSNYRLVKTVKGMRTTVSLDEIVSLLGQDVYDKQIRFGVFLVDAQKKVMVNTFSTNMSVEQDMVKHITYGFERVNSWFTDGPSYVSAEERFGMLRVVSDYSDEESSTQLCIIFHKQDKSQVPGKSFELSFDVMWVGDDNRDSIPISIMTGKNAYIDSYGQYLHDEYRKTTKNTELVMEDGRSFEEKRDILVQNRRFTTVTFDGIIGDAGGEFIGIQINLGGNKTNSSTGSFYFKNMKVKMGGKVEQESYKERTRGDFLLSMPDTKGGQIIGTGYYNNGEKADLIAIPDRNCMFVKWSDEEYSDTRSVVVNGNIDFYPIFRKVDAHIVYVYSDNKWMGTVDGGDYYGHGETATLVAHPNDGYRFVGWTSSQFEGVLDSNPLIIQINEDMDFTAYFEVANMEISKNFENYNQWFCKGDLPVKAEVRNRMAIIEVRDTVKELKLCNVFHNLSALQKAGTSFSISFIVFWDGADPENISADLGIAISGNLDDENANIKQGSAVNKSWTYVEASGIIGENGQEDVCVQIDLAKSVGWNDTVPNIGTFYIKNMAITMDYEVVAEYYKEKSFGNIMVFGGGEGGQVLGTGFYSLGDEAELIAIPNHGYYFAGWSDGVNDNPRQIIVSDDASYYAVFKSFETE